jgi:hypothetical protein
VPRTYLQRSLELLFLWIDLLPIERLNGQIALETDFSGDRASCLSSALDF